MQLNVVRVVTICQQNYMEMPSYERAQSAGTKSGQRTPLIRRHGTRSPLGAPSLATSVVLFLLLTPPHSVFVFACFPGAPGSGCCSAPPCGGSVPRCSPSSVAATHLSSYSHMGPPPPPEYGHANDHHHHHGGAYGEEDDNGAYDKQYGYGEGYGGRRYGNSAYGGDDRREHGGGDRYENSGYGYGDKGGGYGDNGRDKGYGGRAEYGSSKGYGDNEYDRGHGNGYSDSGGYGAGGYGGNAYGGNAYPAMYPQYPTYPISSSYMAPPPAYQTNNLLPVAPVQVPTNSLGYSPYATSILYPATPIQYPSQQYQTSANSLPEYVQQQSLYSSPSSSFVSGAPSPPFNADLYQPNVMPSQYAVGLATQFPSSADFASPAYSVVHQPPLLPNGAFVINVAEPPPGTTAAFPQPPVAGGYSGKAKVKSTKVLTTLVEKAKKDKLEKNTKNE